MRTAYIRVSRAMRFMGKPDGRIEETMWMKSARSHAKHIEWTDCRCGKKCTLLNEIYGLVYTPALLLSRADVRRNIYEERRALQPFSEGDVFIRDARIFESPWRYTHPHLELFMPDARGLLSFSKGQLLVYCRRAVGNAPRVYCYTLRVMARQVASSPPPPPPPPPSALLLLKL